MAQNMFKAYTQKLTREWIVGANVPGGSAVVDANGKPGVTLTDSTGVAKSWTIGPLTIGWQQTGVSNSTNGATVAVDGSWIFAVAGVSNGSNVNGGAGTARGTKVYITSGGALTLTSTSNTYFGVIDTGTVVGGKAPVQIGV